MIYLSQDEIDTYCNIPGIDMNIVGYASLLIDSYIGDISEKTYVEQPKLNRKNKGKLKKIPLTSIDKVEVVVRSPMGTTTEILSNDCIDIDDYGYFTFYPSGSTYGLIFGSIPQSLKITYTSGYATPPEDLKRACAMLSMGIKKRGFDSLKSISDLDVKLEFANGNLINDDIKLILNRYKGV